MYAMRNPVRRHDWGSVDDIPALLGVPPDGRPQAELWLGAFEEESSCVEVDGGERLLSDLLSGPGQERLPFLAKVLAIGSPLSLQIHPAGDEAKPEMLYALEPCRALCGFAPVDEVRSLLTALAVEELAVVENCLGADQESVRAALGELLRLRSHRDVRPVVDQALHQLRERPAGGPVAEAIASLAEQHGDDPAALSPLLLNVVELGEGDAFYCAPGTPHTYLSGVGFEVQASSDAVVRAGLTGKDVDVDAFVRDLVVQAGVVRVPAELRGDERVLQPAGVDFALGITGRSAGELAAVAGPQILLCTRGTFTLRAGEASLRLRRGDSAFVPAGGPPLRALGSGVLLRVTAGRAG
ncbi:MAG: mannose-6-phosphate isomerase, class I [Nocardioidaceae bacterium]